jgi:hypothetical protein
VGLISRKNVLITLDFERRNLSAIGVLTGELVERLPGTLVIGLAIQREPQALARSREPDRVA